MPYTYRVEDGYVSIGLTGTVTPYDLLEIARRFRESEAATGITPHRVTDLSGAEEVTMNFPEIDSYTSLLRSAKWRNDAKSAIVTRTAAHYGMARMFQTLAENPQVEVRIFADTQSALQWVRQDNPAPGRESPKLPPDPSPASGA